MEQALIDFVQHIIRQIAWSRATFGPGPRHEGVSDHIRKELDEIHVDLINARDPSKEWVDVAILALDGLWRSIQAANPAWSTDQVAERVVAMVRAKQAKNELRSWPDWRTADPDKAIEHVRGTHD
jgi:hypothetical protein